MIPESIVRAEKFIRSRFFCEKTNLFYDYLVTEAEDPLISHLPTPYEISCLIPNACGWGTGMEDSMLSAGTMLEAMLAQYEVTGDEGIPPFLAQIVDGMLRCAESAKREGFLPRSVSPVDGKTHYINSSRDQYTHFVTGAVRYLHSGLASEDEKTRLTRALVSFARRCELDVKEENGFCLLREDGGPSMVTEMWGEKCGIEGKLRMPMFYAAAYDATGDEHWRGRLLEWRDEAISLSENFTDLHNPPYAILQMQYSVRLLYDLEPEKAVRERYLALMKKIAAQLPDPIGFSKILCDNPAHLTFAFHQWNKVKAFYIGSLGGLNWYNPAQSQLDENRGFYDIRCVGETVTTRALIPGYRVTEEEKAALVSLADVINYETHQSYAPMALVNAYWIAEKYGREQ